MGELIAARESIYNNQSDLAHFGIDDNLSINDFVVCLHSFDADNLMYVHNDIFGYDNCKFNSALKGTLMPKSQKWRDVA